MRLFLVFAITLCFAANAQKTPANETSAAQNVLVDGRFGFITERIDQEATGRWSHNTAGSLAGYVGGSYQFPPSWRQIKFLAGAEMGFFSSQEKLDSATLDTKKFSLYLTGGAIYQPDFLNGDWGLKAKAGPQLYSDKHSTFSSHGFSQDVGKSTSSGLGFILSLGAFYALNPNWSVSLTFDSNKVLALGAGYAF